MSTHESTTGTSPTRGSTAGASAAESIKETVHHIQDVGETIRENALDFVDTMFGTPRHPDEPRVSAPRTGEDVTHAERARPGDVPVHPADDATARTTSTSAAGHANDAPAKPSDKPATEGSTGEAGPGTTGKGGGDTETAPVQPPPLPPRDVQA